MLSRQASVQNLRVLSCFLDQLRCSQSVGRFRRVQPLFLQLKPNHDHTNHSELAAVTLKFNEYSIDGGTGPSAPVGGSAMGVPLHISDISWWKIRS